MSVELLPCSATFDKSLEPLVLQWKQVEHWVRSKIPITGHIHSFSVLRSEVNCSPFLAVSKTDTGVLVHETGPWIFKVMCDKQALCNELRLSCKSKPDRHAHAFTFTQSPTVPLPHEQL